MPGGLEENHGADIAALGCGFRMRHHFTISALKGRLGLDMNKKYRLEG